MASEIADVFNSLSERFKAGKLTRTTTFHFLIEHESWTIAVGPTHCTVEEGQPTQVADCSLKTSKSVFMAIFRGEHKPSMMDFVTGKIRADNPMLLLALKDAFDD
ncbi:MAG: hypothetical protein DMF61_16845 [Blastocatellia bacterium AA13]|nr:MAG: hypothetical protein DMF61_16845 [Blastocatellia bacterium AA13]